MTNPTFQELLTSQEVRFTNEQLEAWAGMKAFSILYTTDEGRTLALKTSQLAAALLAERKAREVEVERLKHALSYAIQAIDGEIPNLDERMCCNGRDCGCYGSTNRCLLLHDLRQALKGGEQS